MWFILWGFHKNRSPGQKNIYRRLKHIKQLNEWDFSGGPAGKAPCSQHRGPRFDPWAGN